MKKIFCELCDGTDFSKENGMFVCQGCGTKYTAEEARALMREVEGGPSAPAVSSAPAAPVPMGNPNQAQIDNLLLLATNAYDASNLAEAEGYCNKIIELDATCYKAWFLKGKAIGWSSNIKKPRIAESAHSFKQAVDFAPDEEKESVSYDAVEELKNLGLAIISLRKKRFSKYPDNEELEGFISDVEPLVDGLAVLLSKDKSDLNPGLVLPSNIFGGSLEFVKIKTKAENAGVPKDYFLKIALLMEGAALEGFNTTAKKFNEDKHPVTSDLKKTFGEVDNCKNLLYMAIDASDDDDESDIRRYEAIISMEEYVINMKAFPDYSSTYRSVKLTESAVKFRQGAIDNCKDQIQKIKNDKKAKAEEEKKARINAYWEANAEEKTALETEKQQLEERSKTLSTEIAELDKQINAAMSQVDGLQPGRGPAEEESDALRGQVKYLESRRAQLGVFAGKEKKQITADIAALQARIDSLRGNVEQEQLSARADIANKKAEIVNSIKPQRDKKKALEAEYSKVNNRIKEIDNELNNPKMDE